MQCIVRVYLYEQGRYLMDLNKFSEKAQEAVISVQKLAEDSRNPLQSQEEIEQLAVQAGSPV